MANGLLPLIFETKSGVLVFSETDVSKVNLPDVYQEDGLAIEFQAVKQISRTALPLAQKIPLSGYALRVSVGVAGTAHAQATPGDFSLSADTYVYSGTLNLNTSGIVTAIGSASYADLILEIFLSTGAIVHRGQFPLRVRKSVHTTGALVPVATDRALGAQEADRTFMKYKVPAGAAIEWKSEDGLKRVLQYLHDDGSMRYEELT